MYPGPPAAESVKTFIQQYPKLSTPLRHLKHAIYEHHALPLAIQFFIKGENSKQHLRQGGFLIMYRIIRLGRIFREL